MNRHNILKRGILPAFTLLLAATEAGASPAAAPEEAPKPFVLPTIPTKKTRATVETKKLVTNLGTQPRVATDPEVVAEYKELIQTAKTEEKPYPLPPVQCVRTPEGKMILWDGFQRLEANKGIHADIDVEFVEGDEQMAIILSLGANAAHGARRTSRDKRNAVKRAFEDPQIATLTDGVIADLCQVSPSLVRLNRPAMKSGAVRTDKKGRKINTSAIGRGKGGGKKGAKKAAKKGAKKTSTAKADVSRVQEAQKRTSELIAKIEKHIGGAEGVKIRKAIVEGALELTTRDLTDWAGLSAQTAKDIAPLVAQNRMKPLKAVEFYRSDLPEKTLTDLHNRALSHGGKYEYTKDGVKIVVTCEVK